MKRCGVWGLESGVGSWVSWCSFAIGVAISGMVWEMALMM